MGIMRERCGSTRVSHYVISVLVRDRRECRHRVSGQTHLRRRQRHQGASESKGTLEEARHRFFLPQNRGERVACDILAWVPTLQNYRGMTFLF